MSFGLVDSSRSDRSDDLPIPDCSVMVVGPGGVVVPGSPEHVVSVDAVPETPSDDSGAVSDVAVESPIDDGSSVDADSPSAESDPVDDAVPDEVPVSAVPAEPASRSAFLPDEYCPMVGDEVYVDGGCLVFPSDRGNYLVSGVLSNGSSFGDNRITTYLTDGDYELWFVWFRLPSASRSVGRDVYRLADVEGHYRKSPRRRGSDN